MFSVPRLGLGSTFLETACEKRTLTPASRDSLGRDVAFKLCVPSSSWVAYGPTACFGGNCYSDPLNMGLGVHLSASFQT